MLSDIIFGELTFFLASFQYEEHLLRRHRPWELWRKPRRRRTEYFIMICESRIKHDSFDYQVTSIWTRVVRVTGPSSARLPYIPATRGQ